MKKLFISQPMRGKTDGEIREELDNAIRRARDCCPAQMLHILQQVGKKREVAKLSMTAPLRTGFARLRRRDGRSDNEQRGTYPLG